MAGVEFIPSSTKIPHLPMLEYYWASKGRDAREKELQWRVKENVIDTLVSFIWYFPVMLFEFLALQSLGIRYLP